MEHKLNYVSKRGLTNNSMGQTIIFFLKKNIRCRDKKNIIKKSIKKNL
jgi:hypothetical protein